MRFLPDFRLWFSNPRAAWNQLEHSLGLPTILFFVLLLVLWRSKNPLLRSFLSTLLAGWLLYLGYVYLIPHFFK